MPILDRASRSLMDAEIAASVARGAVPMPRLWEVGAGGFAPWAMPMGRQKVSNRRAVMVLM